MTSIGKISFSGASFTNENTVALLHLNVDVCFCRCDPLPEFVPVGSALTVKRRVEAESESIHRTTVKLGFLFNEVIPDTPNLVKAYGKRVSEILALPKVKPQGTEEDEPFRPFIGADCTSVWAAATLGTSSIGVLLLACMLADAWDQIRHLDLDAGGGKAGIRPGRVGLLGRDRKVLDKKGWGGSTYASVILTWTRAMKVLEKLLCNIPQQAYDRAVIRGISS
ncbi:hypothetical protein VDGE_07395 [Verticillium dahliae]|uniref:Uncharacterized protein n=1 Tax=Verticillium dahliae TaxID=27337 RepID=A0A444RQ35_VERDA|nr:hypothetical protein VDGE_07395 [Verticillium dahliae]